MPYKDEYQRKEHRKKYYQEIEKSKRQNDPNRSKWATVRDILSRDDFIRWSRSRASLLKNTKREKIWNFIKMLMTINHCSCGENRIGRLTFHHTDPENKERSIRGACEGSRVKAFEEFLKGIVKCKNCHTIIHNGTPEQHTQKLIDKYAGSSTRKRHKHRNRLLVWHFKQTQKCLSCGLDNSICLLFHHVDSDEKEYRIGVLPEKGRRDISKELEKTICLCQNCHEEFHSIYGTRTTKEQLETYIGKKVILIKVDIEDYLEKIKQK